MNSDNPAGTQAKAAIAMPATTATTPSVARPLRRWIGILVQPALLLVSGAILLVGLGLAQRFGWIDGGGTAALTVAKTSRYICPMMCTPPQAAPGRCPVCAMELVPATTGGAAPSRYLDIDPAARRIANIQTVSVQSVELRRNVRAVGEIGYDEGSLKTIAAYVDGRLDRLYADYTGVVVKQGDALALVYSPRLYSSQVELLLARKALEQSRSSTITRVTESNQDLVTSARQRLAELGMTESQITQLEKQGEATSRLQLLAPMSGTVIEKMAIEGQYVKEGQPIYKLADLSTVWLMLELFPEDAAAIRFGQKVEAVVQSLPGENFSGRVAFVDPQVDPRKRTVGVRVVVPNPDGRLRIGDFAKASIAVPLTLAGDRTDRVYDPELADKWISPRHPHVVKSAPGDCPVCGAKLVPASELGFTSEPSQQDQLLVVPRNAVLMAGDSSVLYVETTPGRFELRRVVTGASAGDRIVILEGVQEGENVATRGSFLIDSQMQLAGNPSLIDPTKAVVPSDESRSPEVIAALGKLSNADRTLAEQQQICPVSETPLGTMGTPPKVNVAGKPVFVCCEACTERLLANPTKYQAVLANSASKALSPKIPNQGGDPLPGELIPNEFQRGLPGEPIPNENVQPTAPPQEPLR